ncbi:cuscuta receptor 1 isoform X5 [Arachis hypogaea]
MEFFSGLSSLNNLNLANNILGGLFPSKEISHLQNLVMLDLSFNYLYGGLTTQALANLSKLQVLKLGQLSLSGSLPIQGLCKMKQLEVLDLHRNAFDGTLDACVANLTSLRVLDLFGNSLTGNVFEPWISSLALLETLSLGMNSFEGIFSLNMLANHSKLKVLELDEMDSETFQVQTETSPWIASFQLEQLDISSCKVNSHTKTLPSFLSSQTSLEIIALLDNDLVGSFPIWLLLNNTKLEGVYFGGNCFTGSFELPFDLNYHHMDQLEFLDISDNKIQGELPRNIGVVFPNLILLDVSNNKFGGHIPESIGEMENLTTLYLGNNRFSGNLHEHILNGCLSLSSLIMDNNQLNGTLPSFTGNPKLVLLFASRNNFQGSITREFCRFGLVILDLSFNNLSGTLPPSCLNRLFINLQGNSITGKIPEASTNMSVLMDLSDNKFTGSIPESIYNLPNLRYLLLAGNDLQGQLSSQICQLKNLQALDLSRNNLSGFIPSCLNKIRFSEEIYDPPSRIPGFSSRGVDIIEKTLMLALMLLFMEQKVQFTIKASSREYEGDILEDISVLDLSSNQLTGKIPYQIGDLHDLFALNLSNNNLSGSIPKSFKKLQSIESLDLSNNKLSGQIPLELQDLHSLAIFNVSYNNLSGRAPDQGQFGTFGDSNYKGNPYLSWGISNRRIAASPLSPIQLDEVNHHDSAVDSTSFYWSFVATFVTVLLAMLTILWINPHWRGAWFYFIEGVLLKCFGGLLGDAFY